MQRHFVVVAGGSGSRMQRDLPKQFIPIAGLPILMHTLRRLHHTAPDASIVLVLPQAHHAYWQELCQVHRFEISHHLTQGGSTRFESVANGLATLPDAEGLVAIHDGVRPFVSPQTILNGFQTAQAEGNAVAVVALKDSIRQLEPRGDSTHVDRSRFVLVQTPQTFRLSLIRKAYYQATDPTLFTDDASVLEAAGHRIHIIEGNYQNIKITTPEDLLIAEAFAQTDPNH
jgi:2-C-methyl-D-erythritol 4-phosphate cytidylyltransferase